MFSYRNSTKELADAGIDSAVISVGSTEQCGPNLPLHLDTLVAAYFARAFGAVLNAYVLPTMPFNTAEEHASFRGTISLRPDTMMRLLEEIVGQLCEQGFRKLAITVGHGGSHWLPAFVKHINWRFRDIVVVSAHHGADEVWTEALQHAGLAGRGDVHGGAVSRALALFLDPDSVIEGEFGDGVSERQSAYADYCTWDRITTDGSWGRFSLTDADIATAEAGQALLEYFVDFQGSRLKTHLDEAFRIKGLVD